MDTKINVDFSRSAVARYIQLATLFRRRVETGEWEVDQRIPTVDALVAEFGVARATVRQALGMLEQEGLIARYRAKGTFVQQPRQEPLWCDVEADWDSLLLAREGARIEVLSGPSDAMPRSRPHNRGRLVKSYKHLYRRHWRDEIPYFVGDVYYADFVYDRIPMSDWSTKTALRILRGLQGIRIVDAHQTLTIGSADIETAELLRIPLNAPTGLMRRSAVDAEGRLIFVAEGYYRGDLVRVDFKLK